MRPDGSQQDLLASFANALEGVALAARGRNFRIQLAFAALALVLAFAFRVSAVEWLVIVVCIGLVLGGECLNTSLEAAVDLCTSDMHPLAKRAKDACAGAVLLFSLSSFVIGVAMFAPRIVGSVL